MWLPEGKQGKRRDTNGIRYEFDERKGLRVDFKIDERRVGRWLEVGGVVLDGVSDRASLFELFLWEGRRGETRGERAAELTSSVFGVLQERFFVERVEIKDSVEKEELSSVSLLL